MTVDPNVLPGLVLLAAEFLTLAVVGFVVVRVALRQTDDRMALAQGMVVGPALWGLTANFVLHLLPGLAGALTSWVIVLVVSAVLAWRSPRALWLPARTVLGFAAATLAIFWVALASRQTIVIPDPYSHLGLTSMMRAGAYPPVFSWLTTDSPVAYHHGIALLVALLTPPFGPDLAFVTELLGAYAWTGFVLVVATVLLRYGGRVAVLALAPLLLTHGAWTLVWPGDAPVILQISAPAGVPAAGLRASLAEIYWPSVPPWTKETETIPPNIYKPLFVLAYALAVTTLERIVAHHNRRWLRGVLLAVMLGFLGILDETVALMVLALWGFLEIWNFVQLGRDRLVHWGLIARAAAGPMLAMVLLAVGGGLLTGALIGSSSSGLALGWIEDASSRRPYGTFETWPGGVALLGLGPVAVTIVAGIISRRQTLVLALATGSTVFLLAAFVIQYGVAPHDVTRFDGHARNFALLALLVALASRASELRADWRYAAALGIVLLVTWPTVALPVHKLGFALGRGVHLANAQPDQREDRYRDGGLPGRYALRHMSSERVAEYIRNNTDVAARVLSPSPHTMSIATGRPNASGFVGLLHLHPKVGPENMDAVRYLEPAALRRLGFTYVHATKTWVASLPSRARLRLDDRSLFELLIRDGSDALYGIRPGFRELSVVPTSTSFEALREAIPASAVVYLAGALHPLDRMRLASVLTQSRLLGYVDPSAVHLLSDISTGPLGEQTPDFVAMPTRLAPSALMPDTRHPIWKVDELAVYATRPALVPGRDPSRQPASQFAVRLSAVASTADRIRFTATFTNHAPGRWTGQDWLVVAADDSPYTLPTEFEADGYTHIGRQWFAGQIGAEAAVASRTYEFDALAGTLAVRATDGFATVPASGAGLEPGVYVLVMRLQQNYLEAAVTPVLKMVLSESGAVAYTIYEGDLRVTPSACPERLEGAESCRKLTSNARTAVSS